MVLNCVFSFLLLLLTEPGPMYLILFPFMYEFWNDNKTSLSLFLPGRQTTVCATGIYLSSVYLCRWLTAQEHCRRTLTLPLHPVQLRFTTRESCHLQMFSDHFVAW